MRTFRSAPLQRGLQFAPADKEPQRVSRNQLLKEQAHNSVEILFHGGAPSIDTVWLALQDVIENMPCHLRSAVWVAMLRHPNETPLHMATIILEAAKL